MARLRASLAAHIDHVEANFEPFTSLVRALRAGPVPSGATRTRDAITSRIFESLGELGLPDSPATRLLVNGGAAMVEEAVISWVQDRQVSKEELLRALTAALPAVLEAVASDA